MKFSLAKHVFAATKLLISGCVKDVSFHSGGTGQPAEVTVGVSRSIKDRVNPDDRVATVRVMIFARNGSILFNEIHLLADCAGANTITQEASTGQRTVVFVANETASTTLPLGSVTEVNDLAGIKSAETDFNESTPIPMYARYDNVDISQTADATTVTVGSHSYTSPAPWPITLVRAGVRIDLTAIAVGDMSLASNDAVNQISGRQPYAIDFGLGQPRMLRNIVGVGQPDSPGVHQFPGHRQQRVVLQSPRLVGKVCEELTK